MHTYFIAQPAWMRWHFSRSTRRCEEEKKPFSIHFIENISVFSLSFEIISQMFCQFIVWGVRRVYGGRGAGWKSISHEKDLVCLIFPIENGSTKTYSHDSNLKSLSFLPFTQHKNSIRVSRWNNERWSDEIGQFNWLLFYSLIRELRNVSLISLLGDTNSGGDELCGKIDDFSRFFSEVQVHTRSLLKHFYALFAVSAS